MPVQNTIITALLTSLLMLSITNVSSAATPIKKSPIKRNMVETKPAKITSIQGIPKTTIRLGSKIKLLIKGKNLNSITHVNLLNGNRPAGKAILVKASRNTLTKRSLTLLINKNAMKGNLTLKFYAGKTQVKPPRMTALKLAVNQPKRTTNKKLIKPASNKPPKVTKVQIVKKPKANKPFKINVLASDDKAVVSIKVIYRGKTQFIKAKTKAKLQKFSFTLTAPQKGKEKIQVFAIDDKKKTSVASVVTITIQPTSPAQESFKSLTITTDALKFTGQRPELFESITITTDPLKFTGQHPDYFKSITITTDPLKFTGQRPDYFKSITITTDPLKFTGQRPELFKSITISTDPLKFTGQRPKN